MQGNPGFYPIRPLSVGHSHLLVSLYRLGYTPPTIIDWIRNLISADEKLNFVNSNPCNKLLPGKGVVGR